MNENLSLLLKKSIKDVAFETFQDDYAEKIDLSLKAAEVKRRDDVAFLSWNVGKYPDGCDKIWAFVLYNGEEPIAFITAHYALFWDINHENRSSMHIREIVIEDDYNYVKGDIIERLLELAIAKGVKEEALLFNYNTEPESLEEEAFIAIAKNKYGCDVKIRRPLSENDKDHCYFSVG